MFIIPRSEIKALCGSIAYQRGEIYYRANKVTYISYDPDEMCYEAFVSGSSRYRITLSSGQDEEDDELFATCSCPAYRPNYYYCKHIAAVLLKLNALGNVGVSQIPRQSSHSASAKRNAAEAASKAAEARDRELTRKLISLFQSEEPPQKTAAASAYSPAPEKQLLDIEFIVKIIHYSSEKAVLALELRVGFKRLFIVQKIKEALTKLQLGQSCSFTKTFSYDPAIHTIKPADQAIIQLLVDAHKSDTIYLQAHTRYYSYGSSYMNEKQLFISPFLWDKLLPLFGDAAVKLEYDKLHCDPLLISDQKPPIAFQLNVADREGFLLEIQGLDQVTLLHAYNGAIVNSTLYRLDQSELQRMTDMKQLLPNEHNNQLTIDTSLIAPFLEQVVPKLRKMGTLAVSKQIADKMINEPLIIKLFLDREGDRLLSRVEYVYGHSVINPLQPVIRQSDPSGLIQLRDYERENQFMAVYNQTSFLTADSNQYLEDEEAIYMFMYHCLPQLEQLAEVYITPAVRAVAFGLNSLPKITIDTNERTEWLEVKFDLEGINEQDIKQILRTIVEKKKYYRLPSGAYISLELDGFQEISELIAQMGIRKAEIKGSRIELPVVRGFHLLDSAASAGIKLGKTFRQLLDNIRNPDNLDFKLPATLEPIMRDYQKFGFQWMKTLSFYQFGGILADDMGLGKTLQGISYILSEQQVIRESRCPALIVTPASLTYNWRNELARFAPELRAVIADGSRTEREAVLANLQNADVIIVSYPLLRRDMADYVQTDFHIMLLDEAQAIKNHQTLTAQSVKLIKARHRFALTGTPIENSLEELWSIYEAVFPTLFSAKSEFHELSREGIARKIRPFLLRRMKSDVLKELPDKIETVQPSELTVEQKKLYMAYLAKLQQETIEQLAAEGLHKNRIKILAGLTRLRQLCCHPSLFVEQYTGGSGKLEQLLEIVDECLSSGKRLLIFSQFTTMLGLIQSALAQRSVPIFYLDGQTAVKDRVEMCDRFNGGELDVFLISLKAGGTGLNLTGADTVVLYDLWWNPAVEQQAADRAHRIGQKKVVQVIRLISEGTIEQKMFELQQRKKDLINEVIQPGEEALSSLTEQEIRELLMIE